MAKTVTCSYTTVQGKQLERGAVCEQLQNLHFIKGKGALTQ